MALNANVVWEIRTDGGADHGGGYKSNAGTTDYSQQANPELELSDAACTTGGTTVTSATGGFTAAMVGNVCYISGTNFTTGWYEITGYTDEYEITVDRDPTDGSDGSSGTLNVGGALNNIGTLGLVLSTAAQSVAGMKAYIRSGTYNMSTTSVNTDGGPLDIDQSQHAGKEILIKGYDSGESRDSFNGTRPVIATNSNAPTNVINLDGSLGNNQVLAFVDVLGDAATSASTQAIHSNNKSYTVIYDCIVREFDGDYAYVNCCTVRCYAADCNTTSDFQYGLHCNSVSHSNGGTYAFQYPDMCVACIADNPAADGFYVSGNSLLVNCVAYNCVNGYEELGDRSFTCVNCIASTCTSHGFDLGNSGVLVNCAHYDCTSGRINATPLIDDGAITLTGDPFTGASSSDFSLNNTAGAGAACREAGIDPYGQTGYLNVGAVQHQGAASGGLLRRLAKVTGA